MHSGDGFPAPGMGAPRLPVPSFAWPPFASAVGDPSAFFGGLGIPAPLAVPATSNAPSSDSHLASGLELEGAPRKARKPYTITKQRERWTEDEHKLFLEALKLYGRAWRKIEEHIGTKTAVQIRSHAQKFFSKLEKGQFCAIYADGKGAEGSGPAAISIPPPRPKRKPAYPYPRKATEPLELEADPLAAAAAATASAQAAAAEAALSTANEAILLQTMMGGLFDPSAHPRGGSAFQSARQPSFRPPSGVTSRNRLCGAQTGTSHPASSPPVPHTPLAQTPSPVPRRPLRHPQAAPLSSTPSRDSTDGTGSARTASGSCLSGDSSGCHRRGRQARSRGHRNASALSARSLPGVLPVGMMVPPLHTHLLQHLFAQHAGAAAAGQGLPFISQQQQQAADQLAASAYMAQMVAGLPHAAGLQPGGLPPAVLQSLIEGRGYTWGPELGAPTGIRPEGYSPANGSARGNGGSGNGNGGSAGGGSAGGGSAGGGSGGTHSSGALSHGPVGGSSPSGSSEEEVEGERSNPGSKGQNFQNGRSSSGSGGTEGTSEKDKVANVSLPGHAPGHLAGAAPGSFSAFTSFARWAPAPSSVWPQHGPADSTNYRTVQDISQMAKQASQVAAAASFWVRTGVKGQDHQAAGVGLAPAATAGLQVQFAVPMPLAPPPRPPHHIAAPQPQQRRAVAAKARDPKEKPAAGAEEGRMVSGGGSGGGYSVSSGDQQGMNCGTSIREKSPHSSSDEAVKVPGSPSVRDASLKGPSSATVSRGNGSGNGNSGNDDSGNNGGASQRNGGSSQENEGGGGSTDREGSAEGSAGRADRSNGSNGTANRAGENSGNGSGGGSSEGGVPNGMRDTEGGSGAGSGADEQERSDGGAAAGAAPQPMEMDR